MTEDGLGARQKLNVGYLNGGLFVAGLLGLLCNSFTVFVIAAVVLVAGAVHAEEIRIRRR